MTRSTWVALQAKRAIVVICVAGVAACTSTAGGTLTPTAPAASQTSVTSSLAVSTASPSASAQASAPESPSPAATVEATAVPTAIHPCDLVTASEVSSLTGFHFGAGQESTTDNNGKLCTYSQEGVVFEVLVGVSPDAATAKKEEPAFKAQLEQGVSEAGIVNPKLTELPDFEPGVDAAVVSGGATVAGQKIKGIALYALKNAVFVAISDLAIGGSVPTTAAMEAQAHTTLGRLP